MKAFLEVHQLNHAYGKTKVLNNCSFTIHDGELVGLLGESGSGKTTMLRLIGGFEQPSSGSIQLGSQTLCDAKTFVLPENRKVGMVFQDYALFPHMSVGDNVKIGQPANPRYSAQQWLEIVGLDGLAGRKPDQLSGGQQQRVAIARAMAARPDLLLLDEPFSNIDESLKFGFRRELRTLLVQEGMTAVFVTHDTKDALAVADRIIILKNGEIRQIGTPEEIYLHPADTYVTGLLGPFNRLATEGERVRVIRAEHCRIHAKGEQHNPENTVLHGVVRNTMYQGGHFLVEIVAEGADFIARSERLHPTGADVTLELMSEHIRTVVER